MGKIGEVVLGNSRGMFGINGRGEITSSELVGIVLAVAGFVILIFILPVFVDVFKGQSDEELCKLSVIARATTTSAGQSLVPLRCKTEKICIGETGNEEDCRQFAGEEVSVPLKIDKNNPDEAKTFIEKTIADEMYDCWSMMGEGKLDLFGSLNDVDVVPILTEGQKVDIWAPRCVVCSRIAVNDSLWKDGEFKENVVDKIDVNSYLEVKEPGEGAGKTYYELFAGTGVSVPDFEDRSSGAGEPSSQLAVIFAQTKIDDTPFEKFFKVLGGSAMVYGSAALADPTGITRNPYVAVFAVGGVGGALAGVSAWKTNKGQVAAAAYCGEFTGLSGDLKRGCSVVRAIEWSPEKVRGINEFCAGGIESEF